MNMKLVVHKLAPVLWFLLSASVAFGQEADFEIRLEALPSQELLIDQTGILDVIITNYGPNEMFGVFSLEVTEPGGFESGILLDLLSEQCTPHPNVAPPPPGSGRFGPFVTPALYAGESVTCSLTIKLAANRPKRADIFANVKPAGQQPNFDPNPANNVSSITVIFLNTKAIPATGTIALLILSFLMLLIAGSKFVKPPR